MVLSSINSWRTLQADVIRAGGYITSAVAYVERPELSAALLDQVIHGFEKEILPNADLVRINSAVMAKHTRRTKISSMFVEGGGGRDLVRKRHGHRVVS